MTESKLTKKVSKKVIKNEKVKVKDVKQIKKVSYSPNTLLKFFKYKHLPENLQERSKLFHDLAVEMDKSLPNNNEKTAGLRKLLEAKDCFIRASL